MNKAKNKSKDTAPRIAPSTEQELKQDLSKAMGTGKKGKVASLYGGWLEVHSV